LLEVTSPTMITTVLATAESEHDAFDCFAIFICVMYSDRSYQSMKL